MNKLINLFIIPVCIFTIFILCGCNHVENKVNQINDVKYSVSTGSAKLIINEVELAYFNAYAVNNGTIPTLIQVSDRFSMDLAIMDSNGNITTTDENISCDTNIVNNILKVTCRVKDYEVSTNNELVIDLENN